MAAKATTKIFIDKYHPKKDGKCASSIRIYHDGRREYYPTEITLTEDEYLNAKAEVRVKKEVKDNWLKLKSLEKKAADIIDDMAYFTWESFEKQYLNNRGVKLSISHTFDEYIQDLLQQGRIGTADSYRAAKVSISKFKENASFSDITPSFLHKYEKWMLEEGKIIKTNKGEIIGGCSITTVGIYLRSLKAIINIAKNNRLISEELFPFGKAKDGKYEIPTGANFKKALSLHEIGSINNYQAEPFSIKDKARDFWMFMYYCNGMNVRDLCRLKYKNLQGDLIIYERSKTKRTKRKKEHIRVPVLAEVNDIINKWGNKRINDDTYIFQILSDGITAEWEHELIKRFTHILNDHLKEIAKSVNITHKLTTYYARHSFATVLRRSGKASDEFIGESLGHGDIRTTKNYFAGFEDDNKMEVAKLLTEFKNIPKL